MENIRGPSIDDASDKDDVHDSSTEHVPLSDAAQTTVRDIFRQLDKNEDGKLEIPEIKVRQCSHAASQMADLLSYENLIS